MLFINLEDIKNRKGASRRADVPKDVLFALNNGIIETKTLTEWLTVDIEELLKNVLPKIGLSHKAADIIEKYRQTAKDGITKRLKTRAQTLVEIERTKPRQQRNLHRVVRLYIRHSENICVLYDKRR
ncbi:DNA alkylation repair protein [Candidatus Magnetoovum chiemensis]|nr:DNA alkylation repair protein [Candidatus Magnetoovum chiemensis]